MPIIERFTIIGGDSKFDLFQHLMLIGMTDAIGDRVLNFFRVEAHFGDHATVNNQAHELFLEISGIDAKDLSGDNWAIKGRFPGWSVATLSFSGDQKPFTGLYDTRRRKGYLDFVLY